MSSFPIEIFYNVTNFLPNDDITDLMLLSKNFNNLVTPRLKKIDEEMSTMNQSIKSLMPSPAPEDTDNEWIPQLDLKKFLPIGSEAKKRMKDEFAKREDIVDCLKYIQDPYVSSTMLPRIKKGMSLERFDDPTFLRILGALIAIPEFCQEYNDFPDPRLSVYICFKMFETHNIYPNDSFDDVKQIFTFYHPFR